MRIQRAENKNKNMGKAPKLQSVDLQEELLLDAIKLLD